MVEKYLKNEQTGVFVVIWPVILQGRLQILDFPMQCVIWSIYVGDSLIQSVAQWTYQFQLHFVNVYCSTNQSCDHVAMDITWCSHCHCFQTTSIRLCVDRTLRGSVKEDVVIKVLAKCSHQQPLQQLSIEHKPCHIQHCSSQNSTVQKVAE